MGFRLRVALAASVSAVAFAAEAALPATVGPVLQATYLGGSLNDYAFALAIHPRTGEVFVAGRTESLDFPGVVGGVLSSYGVGIDKAFVARLNPTLTVLEQATYFGGSGMDYPIAIAIHPATDEVFIAGHTTSADLPGTAGGAQPRSGGHYDAFVARFSPELTQLRQATYLGGSGGEGAEALAIDPVTGDVFVAGETASMDFPGTARGAQAVHGVGAHGAVGYDAFVARLNSTLTVLKQATYLGGSGGMDVAVGLALHPVSGEVFLVGETDSTDFPGTAGGAQAECGRGVMDAFVARLDPTLTGLKQSTCLGSDGYTVAISVAIDPVAGEVLVAGDTSSADFPGAMGGAQAASGGGWEGFVARLSSSLTVLKQTTYLGGAGMDFITALVIHPMTGEVFITGETTSTNLPATAGAAQKSSGGGLDAFAARFDSTLTLLNQATYLGGSDRDTAWALAIDPMGDVVVAGDTRSRDFPATAGGAQPSYGGGDQYGGDAFIARLTRDLATVPDMSPTRSPTFPPGASRRPEPHPIGAR